MLKILLAVDGSESCNKAIDKVVKLTEKFKTEITIITVFEEKISSQIASTPQHISEEISKWVSKKEETQIIVESCSSLLKNKADSTNKIIKTGVPANIICEEADKGDYDLVVLADMGKNAVKKFLLGNTAEKVVRHCKKSVLLVK